MDSRLNGIEIMTYEELNMGQGGDITDVHNLVDFIVPMEEGQSFQQKAGAVVYPQFNHIYTYINIY